MLPMYLDALDMLQRGRREHFPQCRKHGGIGGKNISSDNNAIMRVDLR
jgi:hypothetical protein